MIITELTVKLKAISQQQNPVTPATMLDLLASAYSLVMTLEAAHSRIASLEARTLTVKLKQ